jgi:hypothetical protein
MATDAIPFIYLPGNETKEFGNGTLAGGNAMMQGDIPHCLRTADTTTAI